MRKKIVLTRTLLYELGPFFSMRKLLERNGVVFSAMPTDLRFPRFSDLEPPWTVTQDADGTITIEQGHD